ncbi:hypothetical protein HMPREF0880_00295 [Yokenella regensburgei ATCC 43003]|nr:hypothetical protein HMPREF0880_00295 [Yokenella regensburgei ATCC 43003]
MFCEQRHKKTLSANVLNCIEKMPFCRRRPGNSIKQPGTTADR